MQWNIVGYGRKTFIHTGLSLNEIDFITTINPKIWEAQLKDCVPLKKSQPLYKYGNTVAMSPLILMSGFPAG